MPEAKVMLKRKKVKVQTLLKGQQLNLELVDLLYSKKMVYLKADVAKTSNNYPNVVDYNGKKVWDITKHINQVR